MRFLLSVLAVVFGTAAFADEQSTIQINDPIMFKAFENARAAGGYMTIANTGDEDDLLIGIEIEDRMSMIHESREENGVVRMLHVDALAIPAGDQISFKPGGFHVMLMGLQPGELPVGETVEATLIFDRAGAVPVTFEVVDKDAVSADQKMTH